jgi:ankyrin repeat protein
MEGLPKIVEILLKAGATPNIHSNSTIGETPLQACCKVGTVACAKLLIASGAVVEMRDNFGNNASFWAKQYRQEEVSTVSCMASATHICSMHMFYAYMPMLYAYH